MEIEDIRYVYATEIMNDLKKLDKNACYHHWLGRDYKGNIWALVFGYSDVMDDTEELRGKVAYQPANSIMQCDYDWDWTMPYDDETGEVDDTELVIGCREDIEWLFEQWERIKKEIELKGEW